jgi:hypothetical protein
MRPWHGSFISSLLGEANVRHLRISRSLKPEQLP